MDLTCESFFGSRVVVFIGMRVDDDGGDEKGSGGTWWGKGGDAGDFGVGSDAGAPSGASG
jgi:hypothetical protein